MGYIVDYSALSALQGAYSGVIGSWQGSISSVMDSEAAVRASTNISGNSADRLRDYLDTVYSYAGTSLVMLLELFAQNFALYTEAYYQQVDPASDTCISEQELSELYTSLSDCKTQLQGIALATETAFKGVSDLVSVSGPDFGILDSSISRILSSLDDLDSAVNGVESAHVSSDFAEIDSLLARLGAYFPELCGQSEDFKTSFSMQSFAALSSVPGLYQAISGAQSRLTAQESSFNLALDNMQKRYEKEQAEQKKRQEQAAWAKVGFNIVVGFATAAAVVTAGPLGLAAVGAISGCASALFSASADEYVKYGFDTQKWDKGRIAVHGCIGAVTGLMTGVIPPGAGPCVKSGIKALASALEGVVSTSYDQFSASGRITDVGAIAADAALKGVGTFVGSMIGSEVSKSMGGLVKQNETIKDLAEHVVGGKQHFGAVLAIEGVSNVSSGIAKRFSSAAIEETGGFALSLASGNSVEQAFEEHNIVSESVSKAFDVKSIIGDAGSAVSTAAADNPLYASERNLQYYKRDDDYLFGDSPDLNGKKNGWKGWDSEEYDRMTQKLFEMDERGDDARNYEIFGPPDSSSATDWANTASSPEEIRQIREMEERNEFDIKPDELRGSSYSSSGAPAGPASSNGAPSLSEAFTSKDLYRDNPEGKYTYGRTEHGKTAYGSLELTDAPQRDSAAQRAAGGEDRQPDDDGGHMIGARFNASPGEENLEAQNRDVNRGDYKRMENTWANKIENGSKVFVDVETYRPDGFERPDVYMGYSITENPDGTREWDAFSYSNISHEEQDEFNKIIDDYD